MNQHSFSPPRTTGEQIPFSVLPARSKQVGGEEGMTEKRGSSLLFVMWPYTSKLYVLAKLEMDVKAVARIK